jgi:CRISPR-associated exonuclease Cas4
MITPARGREEPVMVSALEHYSYCPRQCALIHREQTYDENVYTLRGNALHERVDEPDSALDSDVRVERGLPIWSDSLKMVGRADVVEFHGDTPYPVEYKHGPAGRARHADIQVCAQAMCLEEMLDVPVPKGAVYHFSSRKRREVVFTSELRERVRDGLVAIRGLFDAERLPPPSADARCKNCSLLESCLPFTVANKARNASLHSRLFSPVAVRQENG